MTGSGLRHDDLFHLGIVVRDFDRARAELGDVLGVTWGFEAESEQPALLTDGPRTAKFHALYSNEGPVHFELVGAVEGTIWTPNGEGQIHHLGYWSTDVMGDSARLVAAGLPWVARVGVTEEAQPAKVVYHEAASGVYVELVDFSFRQWIFGTGSSR